MTDFVDNQHIIKIIANVTPHRQHQHSTLDIEICGARGRIMLKGNIFRRKELRKLGLVCGVGHLNLIEHAYIICQARYRVNGINCDKMSQC